MSLNLIYVLNEIFYVVFYALTMLKLLILIASQTYWIKKKYCSINSRKSLNFKFTLF